MRIAGEVVLSPKPAATLKKWREVFGITQKELASSLGVSTSVISDYESGRRRSPGVALVKRIVEALIAIDVQRGSKVLRAYERMLGNEIKTDAILDMREFAKPMQARELVDIVAGEVIANGELLDKHIYGYTVLDSPRAILELSAEEFLKIYGLTSERALVFTRVSSGRSPFIAIRVSTIKPGVVVLHGLSSVDALGVKIAQKERIPVILSRHRSSEDLIRELRRKTS